MASSSAGPPATPLYSVASAQALRSGHLSERLLAKAKRPPWNLTGRWILSASGDESLELRHWHFLWNAVWSTRDYAGGEELLGQVLLDSEGWCLAFDDLSSEHKEVRMLPLHHDQGRLASRPQASDAQEKVHAARSLSPRGRRMSPRSRRRPSDEGPVWQSLAPAKSLPSLTVAGAPALASQKEAQLPNLWPSHLGIAPPALSSDSRSRGGVISGSAVRLHSSSQVGCPPLASVGGLGHFQNQKGNSFLVTGFPPPV
ncbi:unnamed protein product [Polarella glacialis]|uniref:Uncharacterized protein n=1 Tax=Polarella glacialis TaxID=89957 RepID=A0A813IYW8_POLGL|nr:unnamed protein product [Polarella glacialis]